MFENKRQRDDYLELAEAIKEASSIPGCTNFPDAFFPEGQEINGPVARWAKAMCQVCPIRRQCLAYATKWESEGIWGGKTPKERRPLDRFPIAGDRVDAA